MYGVGKSQWIVEIGFIRLLEPVGPSWYAFREVKIGVTE